VRATADTTQSKGNEVFRTELEITRTYFTALNYHYIPSAVCRRDGDSDGDRIWSRRRTRDRETEERGRDRKRDKGKERKRERERERKWQ